MLNSDGLTYNHYAAGVPPSTVSGADPDQACLMVPSVVPPDEASSSSSDAGHSPGLLLQVPSVTAGVGDGAGAAGGYGRPAATPGQEWGTYSYYAPPAADAVGHLRDDGKTPAAAPALRDPTRAYVNSVVSNISVYMSSFDGSSGALRMCPGATVEAQPAVKAPEGADEFAAAWFSFAHAIIVAVVAQESVEKEALRAAVGSPGDLPLTLTVREARRIFASGLNSILKDAIQGSSRSLYMSSRNTFKYADEVRQVSARAMEDWLAQGVLPSGLRERYAELASSAEETADASASPMTAAGVDVAVQSVQDLDMLLVGDADVWVTTFFPLYQFLKRDGAGELCPIWKSESTLRRLSIDRLSFDIYYLSSLKRLFRNSAGYPRGVVVPKEWLQRLVEWLTAVKAATGKSTSCQAGSDEEEEEGSALAEALRRCPGPMDTFHAIHVASSATAKHWLLQEDRARVDVVPERLFDYLYLLFGGGPRYVTYGEFTMQDTLMTLLKPRTFRVDVTFRSSSVVDGTKSVEEATVYVEDTVREADLEEVLRIALSLARDDDEPIMTRELEEQLSVAVCDSVTFLNLAVTSLNDVFLSIPMAIEVDPRRIWVEEAVREAFKQLPPASRESLRLDEVHKFAVVVSLRKTVEGQSARIPKSTLARSGVCGLPNIGNTCFMNSALQCISALQPFQRDMLSFPVSRVPTAVITPAYVRLLTTMLGTTSEYADTRELKDAIGAKERRYRGFQQQDANEFIEVMLDKMEEEVNDVCSRSYRERADTDNNIPICELSQLFWDNFLENNTGPIPRDFFHQSKTVFRCLTCGESSTVFDNNLTLSVNIKDPPVRKTLSVTVLVKRPVSGPGKGSLHCDPADTVRLPQREMLLVSLSIRVVANADGTVAAADAESALQEALMKSAELRRNILSPAADNDADETTAFPPHEATAETILSFSVKVLNLGELGTTYAFAECTAGHSPQPATAKTNPEFRVWYFLKHRQDYTATSYGSLVYVDHLPRVVAAPPSTRDFGDAGHPAADAGCSSAPEAHAAPPAPPTDAVASEEEPRSDSIFTGSFGSSMSGPTVAAAARLMDRPLTRQIVKMGKYLARHLIHPVPEDSPPTDSSVAMNTDYMIFGVSTAVSVQGHSGTEASTTAHGERGPKKLGLRVLYRRDRRTPLLDVANDSWVRGDAWLDRCRVDATGGVPGVGAQGGDAGAAVQPSGTGPTANVVIFLEYDGIEFEQEPLDTVGEPPSRYSWGGGMDSRRAGGSGFGAADLDDDNGHPVCTLHECLSRSMEADKLTGDDSWYCPTCKAFREACVQRSLFRIPPCLVISFKRFKMVNGYQANKNNTTVSFPTHLDFAQYLDKEASANPELNPYTQYRLRGVVYHSGSLSYGHYTASIYNDRQGRWLHCNDMQVIPEKGAEPSANGAYILFYEQVRPPGSGGKPTRDV